MSLPRYASGEALFCSSSKATLKPHINTLGMTHEMPEARDSIITGTR